jgi:hypothetical protein
MHKVTAVNNTNGEKAEIPITCESVDTMLDYATQRITALEAGKAVLEEKLAEAKAGWDSAIADRGKVEHELSQAREQLDFFAAQVNVNGDGVNVISAVLAKYHEAREENVHMLLALTWITQCTNCSLCRDKASAALASKPVAGVGEKGDGQ